MYLFSLSSFDCGLPFARLTFFGSLKSAALLVSGGTKSGGLEGSSSDGLSTASICYSSSSRTSISASEDMLYPSWSCWFFSGHSCSIMTFAGSSGSGFSSLSSSLGLGFVPHNSVIGT